MKTTQYYTIRPQKFKHRHIFPRNRQPKQEQRKKTFFVQIYRH